MQQPNVQIKEKPKPTGQPDYEPRLLTAADIPAFAALQEKIRPHLTQPYHLKPKDADYLAAHMDAGMDIVGVFHESGELVAATILSDPSNDTAQLDEYPAVQQSARTIVFQSFMIDPDHQGKGLSHMLDNAAKELHPYADFMAKIATDNADSLKNFIDGRKFAVIREAESFDVANEIPYTAVFVYRPSDSHLRPVCCNAAKPAMVFAV